MTRLQKAREAKSRVEKGTISEQAGMGTVRENYSPSGDAWNFLP